MRLAMHTLHMSVKHRLCDAKRHCVLQCTVF